MKLRYKQRNILKSKDLKDINVLKKWRRIGMEMHKNRILQSSEEWYDLGNLKEEMKKRKCPI